MDTSFETSEFFEKQFPNKMENLSDSETQELHLESHPVIQEYFRKFFPDEKEPEPKEWKNRILFLDLSKNENSKRTIEN